MTKIDHQKFLKFLQKCYPPEHEVWLDKNLVSFHVKNFTLEPEFLEKVKRKSDAIISSSEIHKVEFSPSKNLVESPQLKNLKLLTFNQNLKLEFFHEFIQNIILQNDNTSNYLLQGSNLLESQLSIIDPKNEVYNWQLKLDPKPGQATELDYRFNRIFMRTYMNSKSEHFIRNYPIFYAVAVDDKISETNLEKLTGIFKYQKDINNIGFGRESFLSHVFCTTRPHSYSCSKGCFG